MVEKIANLRIFADSEGRFNLSALDTGGEVLLISQFTLYAETRNAAPPLREPRPPEGETGDGEGGRYAERTRPSGGSRGLPGHDEGQPGQRGAGDYFHRQ